jgi:GrpB-like predicted nucleotidyltransferase (UPF0157 family)
VPSLCKRLIIHTIVRELQSVKGGCEDIGYNNIIHCLAERIDQTTVNSILTPSLSVSDTKHNSSHSQHFNTQDVLQSQLKPSIQHQNKSHWRLERVRIKPPPSSTHPTNSNKMAPIRVVPYSPHWPLHYHLISLLLRAYLTSAAVPYLSIEHIGSTSIPSLAAKDNIDIAILVPNAVAAEAAKEALIWEPSAPEHYKCIGDGGIRGRISMKLADWSRTPQRSVYIISAEDKEGMLGLRGYRDVKRMLTGDSEEATRLRREYEEVKYGILKEGPKETVEYGQAKNEIIRKILLLAGWTEEEVERKEKLDVRVQSEWEDPYC